MKRIAIAAMAVLCVCLAAALSKAEEARVLFINAGKADSALVMAGGRSYLIDAGEDASAPLILGALRLCGVTRLDGLFLTHTHSDHMGGAKAIAENVPIDMLYSARISENKKNGDNKIKLLAEENSLPHTLLDAGDGVAVEGGARFEVMGPLVYNAEDDNDNSLVLKLTGLKSTFLFTGDMQFAEEATLIDAGLDLRSDVLKVGNHGNRDATSPAFAQAVSPSISIISTDTSVDMDSANPRVLAVLGQNGTYVTEDFITGVLVSESMSVSDIEKPAPAKGLTVSGVDAQAQAVTMENLGDAGVDLSNYMLLSERGGELFVFPEGAHIAPGGFITVSPAGGDYAWKSEKDVWHKKKEDACLLYDAWGSLLARY